MTHDVIIIGGGPAAISAGVYAARKRLTTLVIAESWGGQSIVSADIQNWIGTKNISGEELAKNLRDHLLSYQGQTLETKEGFRVTAVEPSPRGFIVTTSDGSTQEGRTVLVATGAHRRKLTVPGAAEFEQKGITYCATCDGPLFTDQDVAVIGGGNAALETVLQLVAYCKTVTLIHRSDVWRADAITLEKIKANPKVKIITNAETTEFKGERFVKKLIYRDTTTGTSHELDVTGVFVEIGFLPSTDFVKPLVETTEHGAVKVDPRTQRTSRTGIWSAGDCTDGLYHQNNIAAGDAVKAIEDIYSYLTKQ